MCEEPGGSQLLVKYWKGDCRDLEINSVGDSGYPTRKKLRRACEMAEAEFQGRVLIVACVGWVHRRFLHRLLCTTS